MVFIEQSAERMSDMPFHQLQWPFGKYKGKIIFSAPNYYIQFAYKYQNAFLAHADERVKKAEKYLKLAKRSTVVDTQRRALSKAIDAKEKVSILFEKMNRWAESNQDAWGEPSPDKEFPEKKKKHRS